MKNISRKRQGFTLIEIIITLCVIGIMSIAIHASYVLMIRTAKQGEIKQKSAIDSKKICESIKSLKNSEFKKVSINEIKLKNFPIFSDESISTLSLTKEDSSDEYKGTVYFDEKFNISKNSGRYKCDINMSKAKAVYDKDSKYFQDVSFERNGVEIDNTDIEKHDINISIEKDKDDTKASIDGKKFSGDLKAEVDKGDSNNIAHAVIKNKDNEILYEEDVTLDTKKTNCVNIHLNFENLKKKDDDNNFELKVDVDNKLNASQNAVVYVYIEKADNANVTVEPKGGEMYIANRYEDDDVDNVGALYSITVNVTDTSDDDKKLFSTEVLKNIKIS